MAVAVDAGGLDIFTDPRAGLVSDIGKRTFNFVFYVLFNS